MNEVLKVIEQRYACRGYKNQPVELEKVEAIAKAGLQAPSALNIQPWHIIGITDKGLIDEINDHVMDILRQMEDQTAYNRTVERGGNPYYNAPVMFLILKETTKSQWADIDVGIVVQNMALAATSLGLGNVIAAMCGTAFEGPEAEKFREKVNWPDGYDFGVGLLVGYPELTNLPHEIIHSKVTYI